MWIFLLPTTLPYNFFLYDLQFCRKSVLHLKIHPLPLPDLNSSVNYLSFHICYIPFLFQWVSSYFYGFTFFAVFKELILFFYLETKFYIGTSKKQYVFIKYSVLERYQPSSLAYEEFCPYSFLTSLIPLSCVESWSID